MNLGANPSIRYVEDNPFTEDEHRIVIIHPQLPTLEFWSPKREFFVTIKFDVFGKKYEVKTTGSENKSATVLFTLHLNHIDTIRLMRGMAGVSLIIAKRSIDSISPPE